LSKLTKAKVAVPKNITTVQYLIYAYGVSYATFKRWKVEGFKWTKYLPAHAGKSVLTDGAFAKTIYTPKRMYDSARVLLPPLVFDPPGDYTLGICMQSTLDIGSYTYMDT
jgi:hypothetical protein